MKARPPKASAGDPRARAKKKLLALKEELAGKGPTKIEPNRTSADKVGGDEDEQPLNEMMQAIASTRNRNLGGVLAKVHKALKKLAEDPESYGICEGCDEPVAPARLDAMPYAELCVQCQSKQDGPRGGPTRKKINDYQ